MISNANQKLIYSTSLILSKETKKTAQALAKISQKSGDTLLRLLEHYSVAYNDLINLSAKLFGASKLFLIIDDSLLEKMYSKLIGGSSDNYDSSLKATTVIKCKHKRKGYVITYQASNYKALAKTHARIY